MTTTVPHFDQNNRELSEAIHEMWVEFLEQAMRRGYVIESSQGHESLLKARQMTPEFYNWLLTLKKTLDPNNIMNPGVYFP
jgi:FAD/FMN-containing dehydrogenase